MQKGSNYRISKRELHYLYYINHRNGWRKPNNVMDYKEKVQSGKTNSAFNKLKQIILT